MKRSFLSICLSAILLFVAGFGAASAQQSSNASQAAASTLSYQGVLTTKDGVAVPDGDYSISVTLYRDADGASSLWSGTYAVHTSNGVFNVMLGSGEYPLPAASALDGTLFLGVKIGEGAEMPLTQLSSSISAINVADGSITAKKMGTDYIGSISINGQRFSTRGGDVNIVTGEGMLATVDQSTNSIVLSSTGGSFLNGKGADPQTSPYINNSTALQTSASFNISGSGQIGTTLTVGGITNLGSDANISGDMSVDGTSLFTGTVNAGGGLISHGVFNAFGGTNMYATTSINPSSGSGNILVIAPLNGNPVNPILYGGPYWNGSTLYTNKNLTASYLTSSYHLNGDVTGLVSSTTVGAIQNVPVSDATPTAGQVLVYTFIGDDEFGDPLYEWVPTTAGGSSGWALTGNSGTTSDNFLGTTDAQPLVVKTFGTQRMLIRSDGTMAMGNNPTPAYPSNDFEIDLQNVGGSVTSGEQNEGVNVLASAAANSALSIGLRGRMDASGVSVTSTRGISGAATVSSGSTVGTSNPANGGGATGGYFNANIETGGSIGSYAAVVGVGADVDNTGNATTAPTNEFIGGRFGANPTVNGTSFGHSPALGMFATASGSSTSNTGAFGAANGSATQIATFAGGLPAGFSSGIAGYNPSTSANQYAGYFGGNVSATGSINSATGYQVAGAAPTGHYLRGDGSGRYVDGTIQPGDISGLIGGLGVQYNVTTPQNGATVGANNLFNVAYNTNDAAVAGAVVNSTSGATTGATSATGLTLTAKTNSTTGPATVTGLNAGATGDMSNNGSSNVGVEATSNTSSSQLSSFKSGLNTLGTFSGGTETSPFGASILGYNPNDGDNQYAAYFAGNNSNQSNAYASGVLRVVNNMTNAGNGGQPTAGFFSLHDNVGTDFVDGGSTVPTTIYADNTSSSENSQLLGIFSHTWTHASGQAGNQATGVFSYTVGTNDNAVANARVTGVAGWADAASTTSKYNLIGVEGGTDPYGISAGGVVPRSIGGYFIGQSAASANLGMVAQVGGSTNDAWKDAALSGMNAAVVGMNYGTPSATNLAGYFGGNLFASGTIESGHTIIIDGTSDPRTITGDETTNITTNSGDITLTPNSGKVGIGLTTPGVALDVNGAVNSTDGYQVGGAAPAGQYLRGDGSGKFVSGTIQPGDVPASSGNYIQNQTSSPQSGAGFNIDGGGTFGGTVNANIVSPITTAGSTLGTSTKPYDKLYLSPKSIVMTGTSDMTTFETDPSGNGLTITQTNGTPDPTVTTVAADGTLTTSGVTTEAILPTDQNAVIGAPGPGQGFETLYLGTQSIVMTGTSDMTTFETDPTGNGLTISQSNGTPDPTVTTVASDGTLTTSGVTTETILPTDGNAVIGAPGTGQGFETLYLGTQSIVMTGTSDMTTFETDPTGNGLTISQSNGSNPVTTTTVAPDGTLTTAGVTTETILPTDGNAVIGAPGTGQGFETLYLGTQSIVMTGTSDMTTFETDPTGNGLTISQSNGSNPVTTTTVAADGTLTTNAVATQTLSSAGDITATGGDIVAATGDVTAAQGDVTATVGDIDAPQGVIESGNTIRIDGTLNPRKVYSDDALNIIAGDGSITLNPTSLGNVVGYVGINLDGVSNFPTQMLDVNGGARIRTLPTNSDDDLVTADANGNLSIRSASTLVSSVSASNGLTNNSGTIILGGTLTGETDIAGNGYNLNLNSDGSAGNVGIGFTDPQSTLDVNGNIHASGTITSGNSVSINGAGTGPYALNSDETLNIVTTNTNTAGDINLTPASQLVNINGNLTVAGSVTANTYYGDGSNLTGLPDNSLAPGSNGNILEWSGTDNVWEASPTLSDINGSLVANGGAGVTPTLGAGTRMMWIPAQASFFVGGVDGTQWDNGNVGQYSFASGFDVSIDANSQYSTAMGYHSYVQNSLYSTALGSSSVINGYYATAMGSSNAQTDGATAMGDGSNAQAVGATAMGYGSNATGNYSTAMGSSNANNAYATAMGNSLATGENSTAMGSAEADGQFSTAMGDGSTDAQGYSSTAMGFASTTDGNSSYATAMGNSQVTFGNYSTAMGQSTASGNVNGYATAMGLSGASGDYTTAMGNSTATGNSITNNLGYSTAMGSSAANGDYSTAMGKSTANGDYSTAMGNGSSTDGNSDFSTAMGNSQVTFGPYATAMGNSTANATHSTAMGKSTAGGPYSTAMGVNSDAEGQGSTAMGNSTTDPNSSYSTAMGSSIIQGGQYATAMGSSFASNIFATAMGQASATGNTSIAMGYVTTSANGDYSTAIGSNATTTNAGSFVYGDNSTYSVTDPAANSFTTLAVGGYEFYDKDPSVNPPGMTISNGSPAQAGEGTVSAGFFIGDGSGLTGINNGLTDGTTDGDALTWKSGDQTWADHGALAIANGGTGKTTAAEAINALLAPQTAGVLESNGSTVFWGTISGSGTVTDIGMTVPSFLSVSPSDISTNGTFAITLSGTALPVTSGGTGATTASGARTSLGAAASGTNGDITSLTGLTTALSVSQGGTGANSASGARASLGAAASGPNSDITSLTGLTTVLPVSEGGTDAAAAGGNTVFASPADGSLGPPGFRRLNALDIPGGYIQNGTGVQSSASFNVDGSGQVGTTLTVGGSINTQLGAGVVHSSGAGTNLTSSAVDLSSEVTGTLADSHLNSDVTTQGNTFNHANQLVQLNGSGKLPAIDGSQLTNLPNNLVNGAANGNILEWNGTSWSYSPTLTDANGSVVANGGTGTNPNLGAGTRMMWIPSLGAFRVGAVDGAQWDGTNVGTRSIAEGWDTKASGQSSTAIGTSSIATGEYSTALGFGNNVGGFSATALGTSNVASGNYSIAIGYEANTNSMSGAFAYSDGSATTQNDAANQFMARASGGYKFYDDVSANPALTISGSTLSASGVINAATGYTVGGALAAVHTFLRGNGTDFVPGAIVASDVPDLSATYIKNSSSLQTSSNFDISGNGIVNGKVGIGGGSAATPTASLEVNGFEGLYSAVGESTPRPGIGSYVPGEIIGYSSDGPGADAGFLRLSAGGGTNEITKTYIDLTGNNSIDDADRNIIFGTRGTEKMRITSGNNVGIGTSNPGAMLDVAGTINSGSTISAAQGFSTGYGYEIGGVGPAYLVLSAFGTNNIMVGSGAGSSNGGSNNSGMGAFALTNNSTGANNTAIGYEALATNQTTNNNTAIGYRADVSADGLSNATAIGANAIVGESNALVLGGTGPDAVNVGIGTTTPQYPLDVSGVIQSGGDILLNENGRPSIYPVNSSNLGSDQDIQIRSTGAGVLELNEDQGGDIIMAVNQGIGSNVGIGPAFAPNNNTPPQARLDVDGSINSSNGYKYLNAAPTGHYLRGDGSGNYVDGTIQAGDLPILAGEYIVNSNGLQAGANFNIGGNGRIGGNLYLPNTTSSVGAIYMNGAPWWHNYGTNNAFLGLNAGNFTLTGTNDVAFGPNTLQNTTGGSQNTAIGAYALVQPTSGQNNTGVGYNSLNLVVDGNDNTAVGNLSGNAIVHGSENTFLGSGADAAADGLTNATAIGYGATVGVSNALILGGTGANAVMVGIGTPGPVAALDVEHIPGQISLYVSGQDIVGADYPAQINTNTATLEWGSGTNQTLGRILRLLDANTNDGGPYFYDQGIDQSGSYFLMNGLDQFEDIAIAPNDHININGATTINVESNVPSLLVLNGGSASGIEAHASDEAGDGVDGIASSVSGSGSGVYGLGGGIGTNGVYGYNNGGTAVNAYNAGAGTAINGGSQGGTTMILNNFADGDVLDLIPNNGNALVASGNIIAGYDIGVGTSTPTQSIEVAEGNILLSNTDNTAGQLQLQGTTTHVTTFAAGDQDADINYTLPATVEGAVGDVLTYNNGGRLSWEAAGAGSGWGLTGNAGTTPGTNFIGTSDAEALYIDVNGAPSFVLNTNGSIQVTSGGNARGLNAIDLQSLRSADNQVASGTASVIGGGGGNLSSGDHSFVGGGLNNENGGFISVIGGGSGNNVANNYNTIGGGNLNSIAVDNGTIGGGVSNTVTGNSGAIAGGNSNVAVGAGSFIGGGGYDGTNTAGNYAIGAVSVVVGGLNNSAGGSENAGSGDYGVIAGGQNNIIPDTLNTDKDFTPDHATISGGGGNDASAPYATVMGGGFNTASGYGASVVGYGNIASGAASFAAGTGSTASGNLSTALGGATATGDYSVALGGFQGTTLASGTYSVAMGEQTTASGFTSTAMGNLTIASGDNSTAMGNGADANSHPDAFVYSDGSAKTQNDADNQFMVRASGGYKLFDDASANPIMTIGAGSALISASDVKNVSLPFAIASTGTTSDYSDQNTFGRAFRIANTLDGSTSRYFDEGIDLAGNLYFTQGNSLTAVEALTITPSGSIGIGTTTPNAVLEVNDNGSGSTIMASSATGNADIMMNSAIRSTIWPNGPNVPLDINSNPVSDMQIRSAGTGTLQLNSDNGGDVLIGKSGIQGGSNVGIGPAFDDDNLPTDRLDVDGNIHASGTITSGNSIIVDGTTSTRTITSDADLNIVTNSGDLSLSPASNLIDATGSDIHANNYYGNGSNLSGITAELSLPLYQTVTDNADDVFRIDNTDDGSSASNGIEGHAVTGSGLVGSSLDGYGVSAFSTDGNALQAASSASNGYGILGTGYVGILGTTTGTDATSYAVEGNGNGNNTVAMFADNTGTGIAVSAISVNGFAVNAQSTGGVAVAAISSGSTTMIGNNSGNGTGIEGITSGTGTAVTAYNLGNGVAFSANSGSGDAIDATSTSGNALQASTSAAGGYGIHGTGYVGILGTTTGTDATSYAIEGDGNGDNTIAMYAHNTGTGTGVSATAVDGIGVQGKATNGTGIGVQGVNQSGGVGVEGFAQGVGTGVLALNNSGGSNGYGLDAESYGTGAGIYALNSAGGYAIDAHATSDGTSINSTIDDNGSSNSIAAKAWNQGLGDAIHATASDGYAIYATSSNPNFQGNATIQVENSGQSDAIDAISSSSYYTIYAENDANTTQGVISAYAVNAGDAIDAGVASGNGIGLLVSTNGSGDVIQANAYGGGYALNATGNVILSESGGNASQLQFQDISGNNYVTTFAAGDQTVYGSINYVLPIAQGDASTVLTNDGSGNLSWGLAGGNPSWSLGGNASPSPNAFGTTTNTDVLLTANNQTVAVLSAQYHSLDIPNGVITEGGEPYITVTPEGRQTLFGLGAGSSGNSSQGNTGIGANALSSSVTGSDNTAVGWNALAANTAYEGGNTAVGAVAGRDNTDGYELTLIGSGTNALDGAGLAGATAIGAGAYVTASNSMVLGSISGVNGATASTNVGIGTTSPSTTLVVIGTTTDSTTDGSDALDVTSTGGNDQTMSVINNGSSGGAIYVLNNISGFDAIDATTATGGGDDGGGNAITANGNVVIQSLDATPSSLSVDGEISSGDGSNPGILAVTDGNSHTASIVAGAATATLTLPATSGTLALSSGSATAQATPSDPTGTTSAGPVQMGIAGSITPSASGKILLIISGDLLNSNGDGAAVQISYGTGIAPSNGTTATGTTVGTDIENVGAEAPFTTNAVITGLTPGTAYWIDLQVKRMTGGVASVARVSISAIELP